MIENSHSLAREEAAQALNSDLNSGLSQKEAARRLAEFGPNSLQEKKASSWLVAFLRQFKNFMVLVLLAAAVLSAFLKEVTDAIIIMVILLLNAILGMVQEKKAENSLAALKKISAPGAKVIREGQSQKIPAKDLVFGDLVIIETGDYVPADLRLTESSNLKIEESVLTGEAVPVDKDALFVAKQEENIPLSDRYNLAFASTTVTYGRGMGLVCQTGMNSQVGQIARMIQETKSEATPLQKRLDSLGKIFSLAVLVICALVFALGLIQGREPFSLFLIAVSLAVAAIPEGLPAVSTIVMAMGVQRMAKGNAIIRRLPSVETLGSATVICSDKTGTLTQNRMTVTKLAFGGESLPVEAVPADQNLELLLECALLCNDARLESDDKAIGDPTETALLYLGQKKNYSKNQLEQKWPRQKELPFDSDRKRMSTLHVGQFTVDNGQLTINDNVNEDDGKGVFRDVHKYRIYCKGGLDEILAICGDLLPEAKDDLHRTNEALGAEALRVLAFAYKDLEEPPPDRDVAAWEKDLHFIGLVGIIDPPRPEAVEAVAACLSAGIKPVMITGDHKLTALAIARQLGLVQSDKEAISGVELDRLDPKELQASTEKYGVYARVSPQHKVQIVESWQAKGQIVAMTGDGVNDAPALKKADIGVAMGITGTDITKEAADMVLTDDNFATIVQAVREGRRIFDNILKTIQFLLSCNLGEILTLLMAFLLSWEIPLLPIHLLWINLITDSLIALALGLDPAVQNIMERPPRPQKSFFSKGMVWRIGYQGLMIGSLSLTAFWLGSRISLEVGRTMAFCVLAFSQIVHSYNTRSNHFSAFSRGLSLNKFLWLANAGTIGLMLLLLLTPLAGFFHLTHLSWSNWLTVTILSLSPLLIVEAFKAWKINMLKDE
ncbi:MAG: cation-translocating P-type ATPase [Clostridiales bacterium]|nr:cation-translocating P-type ATPase [Clostridiales bacterium]